MRARLASTLGPPVLVFIVGCSAGPMDISERYLIGAANGTDRVYYRVTLNAKTRMGESEFRQGWFPAEVVDQLFGEVSDQNTQANAVRDEIRQQLDQALIEARRAYLAEALKHDADPDKLKALSDAIRRVRQTPTDFDRADDHTTTVIEYNPGADLITRHDGQKQVMVLSSNPDEIMNDLSQIAGDSDTRQVFDKFSAIVAVDQRARLAGRSAQADARRKLGIAVNAELEQLRQWLETGQRNREQVLARLDAVLSALEASEP